MCGLSAVLERRCELVVAQRLWRIRDVNPSGYIYLVACRDVVNLNICSQGRDVLWMLSRRSNDQQFVCNISSTNASSFSGCIIESFKAWMVK